MLLKPLFVKCLTKYNTKHLKSTGTPRCIYNRDINNKPPPNLIQYYLYGNKKRLPLLKRGLRGATVTDPNILTLNKGTKRMHISLSKIEI